MLSLCTWRTPSGPISCLCFSQCVVLVVRECFVLLLTCVAVEKLGVFDAVRACCVASVALLVLHCGLAATCHVSRFLCVCVGKIFRALCVVWVVCVLLRRGPGGGPKQGRETIKAEMD